MTHVKRIIITILAIQVITLLSITQVLMISTIETKHPVMRSPSFLVDYGLDYKTTLYDRNRNGVSDIIDLGKNNTYNVIVTLKRINAETLKLLKQKAIKVSAVYHSALNAIYISNITLNEIYVIKNLLKKNLILIEPNFKRSLLMDKATKIIGIRDYLWPFLNKITEPVTVAIIDTGIDVNHKDLSNKLVYWEDLVEGYNHPVDFNGHGTMVSSIIAGSGASSSNGIINITTYGKLRGYSMEVFSLDVPFNQNVSFHLDIKTKTTVSPTFKLVAENEENYRSTLKFHANETKKMYLKKGYYKLYLSSDVMGYYRLIINLNKTIDKNPPTKGVNNKLKLAVFKIFKGNSSITYDNVILAALDKVAELADKLKIVAINLSLGGYVPSLSLDYAINNLAKKGIVTVVAAGNSYLALANSGVTERQIGSPATAAYAITVGGVNDYLGIAIYSSRGGSYTDGPNLPYIKPDIVAPSGGLIYGSWIIAADTNNPDGSFKDIHNDYTGGIGTSFAAPLVTGIVASLISYLIQKNKWRYNLSSVLFLKSLLLASAIETRFIGLHETSFIFNNTVIHRDPPSFDYGKKDYDEGFGLVHIPSLLFALQNNFSDFKAIMIKITERNASDFSIDKDLLSLGFIVNLDGCYKIRVDAPAKYYAVVYKLYGWDGSPIYVRDIRTSSKEITLNGKGSYFISIKPINGGTINDTITIIIQKTPCINLLIIVYVVILVFIGAIVLFDTFRRRMKNQTHSLTIYK